MLYAIFLLIACYLIFSSWNGKPEQQTTSGSHSDNYLSGHHRYSPEKTYRNQYRSNTYYNDEEYRRYYEYRERRLDALGRWFLAGLLISMVIFILL